MPYQRAMQVVAFLLLLPGGFAMRLNHRGPIRMNSAATPSRPIRVGLLVEPTPFTHVSGYSNRFNEMLKYLAKGKSTEVEITTPDDHVERPTEKFGFKVHNMAPWKFPLYKHLNLVNPFMALAHFFTGVELVSMEMLKKFKPDLIHVTSPGFFVFVGLWLRHHMRKALVLSYHTHLPVYARKYLRAVPFAETMMWAILKWVHNQADLTLVTSPQIKEELEANGVQRVQVWRKGIDTEIFDPSFADENMRNRLTEGHPDSPLLVYVGRLGEEKRVQDLKAVLAEIPNARLAIVGAGPYEDQLKAHFKGTNTHFTGMMRGKELSQAFASADVFVMPSDSETLGFVVLESMASGVPVVGANAGGIPNLIDHGKTGYLAEPGNAKEFAAHIKKLIDDKPWRETMSLEARAEAERWDWESATRVLREEQYPAALKRYSEWAQDKEASEELATQSVDKYVSLAS